MNAPDRLDHALALAEEGFWIFPIKAGAKAPPLVRFKSEATRDCEKIEAWWRDYPDCNFGIYTGRFKDDDALLVVDIDRKNGVDGKRTLDHLRRIDFELPETSVVDTPSGGQHLFFRVEKPVGQRPLGEGLDVRSRGGYVVAPGSAVGEKRYTVRKELPIAPAPPWLVERCQNARKPATRSKPSAANGDPDRARDRAIRLLSEEAPPGEEGGRNETGYRVACRLKDLGVPHTECAGLLTAHWKCYPPLDHSEIEHIADSAYKYGLEPPGVATPEAAFAAVEVAEDPDAVKIPWLARMNGRYAVTTHHGKTLVHEPVMDHGLGHPVHQWITFDDLKRRHMAERVQVVKDNGGTARRDLGSAWLEHPKRRQYRAEAFMPGETAPPDVLNLWRGFAIKPRAGRYPRIKAHIQDVICNGADTVFDYVWGWMARMVQRPWEPGQVALVLQGGEGTGKGTFAGMFLAVVGQHGLSVSQPKHLVGAFNAHLQDKILVFADEAFFAGNPSHRGPLYALITEPHVQIEPKGVDARTVRNVLHIIMATNEDWAVPAGVNARRFCVLRVSEAHRQNTAYFDKLRDEVRSGGLAAMLHDLLETDLSDFNVHAVPQTKELARQKIMSLRGPSRWLFDCLHSGTIGERDWADDGLRIPKDGAYRNYEAATKGTREPGACDRATWSRAMRKILDTAIREERPAGKGRRERVLVLGSLADCRRAFEKYLRQPLEWEPDD